jgi:hypothetical protein
LAHTELLSTLAQLATLLLQLLVQLLYVPVALFSRSLRTRNIISQQIQSELHLVALAAG